MQYDEKHHIPIKAKAAGVAIINNQCQILLVHEKLPGKAGLWHIPSGSVEENESLEGTNQHPQGKEIRQDGTSRKHSIRKTPGDTTFENHLY